MNIVFISAVLPVILLLVFIYRKDKSRPEPLGKLLVTFFAGCFCVIPAAIQESAISLVDNIENPVASGLFNGFVVAGFSEELWKLILLMLVVWKSRYFDEYFDGIVYAAYLSLGFACVENIMYVFSSGNDPLGTALVRGILAVPAHFLFAVIMGYHLSLAKFDIPHRNKHLVHALLYPMLMHGTYDALLMISQGLSGDESMYAVCGFLFIAFVYFDIKMWRWGLKRIKRMQERSREQTFDRLHPFDGFTWTI